MRVCLRTRLEKTYLSARKPAGPITCLHHLMRLNCDLEEVVRCLLIVAAQSKDKDIESSNSLNRDFGVRCKSKT